MSVPSMSRTAMVESATLDEVWCGHRDGSLSRVLWKVHSKDHAMTASSSGRHAGDDHDDRVTPLSGTQLRVGGYLARNEAALVADVTRVAFTAETPDHLRHRILCILDGVGQ